MTTNQIPALYMTTIQIPALDMTTNQRTVMDMTTNQIMEALLMMSQNLMTSLNVTLTFMTRVAIVTMETMILTQNMMTHRLKWWPLMKVFPLLAQEEVIPQIVQVEVMGVAGLTHLTPALPVEQSTRQWRWANPASVGTAAEGTVAAGERDPAISVAAVAGMIVEEGEDRIVEVTVVLLVGLVMTNLIITQ